MSIYPPLTLAQNAGYEVKGVVVDKSGMPILGATVVEKGTTNGVSTGIDGDYAIRAAGPESVIEVSYVGYKTVSLVASSSLLAHLTLEEDAMGIDDVVVIGYGVQKKANLTGAVATVSQKELKDRPVSNVGRALQGVIPNLNVTLSSGQPGAGATYNIRGTTSPNGGSPLVLIDGVETYPDRINSNDIESINILKDAGSAAIYGARSSNGVILITTKNGRKEMAPQIRFSAKVGVENPDILYLSLIHI